MIILNIKLVISVLATSILFCGAITFASGTAPQGQVPQPEKVIKIEKPKTIFEGNIKNVARKALEAAEKIKFENNNSILSVTSNDGTISTYNLDNKEIQKWIVRNSIDLLNSGKDSPQDELLLKSVNSLIERQMYYKFAKNFYNVKFNPADIKKYITEQKEFFLNDENSGPFAKDLSDGLGITTDELFYDWEYDNFLKNYLWLQIKPQLEKENPIQEDELRQNYDNRLIEIFQKQLDDYFYGSKAKIVKIK